MVFFPKATFERLPRNNKTDSHMEKGTLFEVQHTQEITMFNEIHLETGCFFHCHVRFWGCNFSNDGFAATESASRIQITVSIGTLIGGKQTPKSMWDVSKQCTYVMRHLFGKNEVFFPCLDLAHANSLLSA